MNDLCQTFESVLSELVAAHEELLELAHRQRHAMSSADVAAIEPIVKRQGEVVQRIAQLEEQRRKVVASLGGAGQSAVTQIAAGLPEPARGRIMQIALKLREVLTNLQEQNRVLRAAAGALVAHMDGLMQQVSRRVSDAGAGVYGRRGRITGEVSACALDMRH